MNGNSFAKLRSLVTFKTAPWLVIALLGIISLAQLASPATTQLEPQDPLTADTFIPKGYVLVPLKVENLESVNPLMGQFGIGDIFSVAHEKAAERIIEQVRIIRAPLDPMQLGALIDENNMLAIRKMASPVFITIKNPNAPQKPKRSQALASRITYGE